MADYLVLLLGMGLVTYLPRWLPLHYLSRRSLPEWFVQWLDLIPAAILSALLLPALVLEGEHRHLDLLRARAVGWPYPRSFLPGRRNPWAERWWWECCCFGWRGRSIRSGCLLLDNPLALCFCRAQPLAAVLVLVIGLGGSYKFEKSITSTASLSTSTMDNAPPCNDSVIFPGFDADRLQAQPERHSYTASMIKTRM